MSTSSKQTDNTPTPPEESTVILLLRPIADTTWRMFVPTIGMTLIGLFCDTQLGTKPWLTIAGIILGVIVTAVLLWRQFKQLEK